MPEWSSETVYAIARWSEVFETAESRRHRQLAWIAHPVSFNSTGFQLLLDRYSADDAAALYGAWCALTKIAATAPNRGVLAGHKGEPYTTARLSRLSGFSQSLFDKLVLFCVEIGWLVVARADTGLPDITRQDITRPDRTGPDRTEPDVRDPGRAGPAEVESFFQTESAAATTRKPLGRTFGELLRHESVADLCQPAKTVRGKLTGGVFTRLTPSQIASEPDKFWLLWYQQQLGSRDPVVREGTLAEAAVVLAAVYAARQVPASSVRSSRLAIWISWIKGQDGSQITDEQLQGAAQVVREARSHTLAKEVVA